MDLCNGKSLLDLGDPCARASWATLIPGALALALYIFSIPIPAFVRRIFEPLTRQFRNFLTLPEAEALDAQALAGDKILQDEDVATTVPVPHATPLWRTVVFAFVGIAQALWWLGYGSYLLYDNTRDWWKGTRALVSAFTWLYTAARPIARPTVTAPGDMFTIYLVLLGGVVFELGGYLFDHNVYGIPLPNIITLGVLWTDLFVTVGLLGVVLAMPLAIPSQRVKKEDIVSHCSFVFDYLTHNATGEQCYSRRLHDVIGLGYILLGVSSRPQGKFRVPGCWVILNHVHNKGRNVTLKEDDVWDLSPSQQSRPVFVKFSQTKFVIHKFYRRHHVNSKLTGDRPLRGGSGPPIHLI